ncbi:MAG: glycosyltransferase [Tissierellales bacterium]|nr:glycosyltransferase [Tissierellales bacterium]MBN2826679.1 glycosyltransferase [Tissierellales bacterium]
MVILDILSTNQGAYRLVKNRVLQVNKQHLNYVVCPDGPFTQKMTDAKVPVICFEIKRSMGLGMLREMKALVGLFLQTSPDVVHSHNSKTGALSRLAAYYYKKRYGKKLLVIHQVHGFYFNGETGIKKTLFQWIEKQLARLTDILLFQNQKELDMSMRMGMNRHARLVYIGNGINFEEFPTVQTKVLQKGDRLNILFVARVEEIKNQLQMIEALNILIHHKHRTELNLYLIGEQSPDYLKKIEEKIIQYELRDFIVLTGMLDREELMSFFTGAFLSVLTSYKEGKPRAMMESLYMGIPCIGTNVVGTEEVIQDGYNGYLVPLGDAESLATRIEQLIDNPTLWHTLAQQAQDYATLHFDERQIIDRLIALYGG